MSLSRIRRASFVVAASSLVLAAGTAPAFATDSYTVPLHQPVPITAASFGEKAVECAEIPASQDGWHFIAPGNPKDISFVKLTVTFEPGGQQVITTFGAKNQNHAYVASAPGAKLTSAVAEVKGGGLEWFNLSHTCPSKTGTGPSPSQSSSSPSASASASASASTSASASASTSAGPSASASPSVSPSAAVSSPAPTGSTPAPGGDLAKTGSDAPIGLLATMAAALIAVGGVLVFRRRKAGAEG